VAKLSNKEFDPAVTALTDIEERVLKQGGWKPGDPLPDLTSTAIGKRLTEAFSNVGKAAENMEGLTPVAPDTPPLQVPKPRDIGDLTPEERAEVVAALKAAKQLDTDLQQQPEVPTSIASVPGMAEAYKTAAELPDELTIVDDTQEAEFDPTVTEPEPPVEQPQTETPAPDAAGTANVIPHVQCPRCSHFIDQDVVEPTDADKQAFVESVLAGLRFYKTYTAFGGKIAFTLRSLLPSESELALFQLDQDCETRRVLTQAQYIRYLQDYRLSMGLEMVHKEGKAKVTLSPIDLVRFDETKHKTALPQTVAYIYDRLFVNDHLRHVIGVQWAEFQRLTETMEVRAESPDFWSGIESAS
jgi:hypothetical protein